MKIEYSTHSLITFAGHDKSCHDYNNSQPSEEVNNYDHYTI